MMMMIMMIMMMIMIIMAMTTIPELTYEHGRTVCEGQMVSQRVPKASALEIDQQL